MTESANIFKEHEANAVLGVREFQQKTGRLEMSAFMERYEAQFIDERTGLLKGEYSQKRPCPVCHYEEFEVSFVKSGFSYCLCKKCTMLYVNPLLSEERLASDYSSGEEADMWAKLLLDSTQKKFDEPKFVKALELMEEKITKNSSGKILDIGCSSGHFLRVAASRSWKGTGIELNNGAADNAAKLGFDIVRKPLTKGLFPKNSFDAVTMWDVFEHLPNPSEILQIVREILIPGGQVAMIVPNADSLAARILREKCNMFRGSKHVNIFSPSTLETILNTNGFRVQTMESLIGEVGVINNYLEYQDPYKGGVKKQSGVLGVIEERLIHQKMWGYKLFCIASRE